MPNMTTASTFTVEDIARVAYDANRAYQIVVADPNPDGPWDEVEQWRRDSYADGVRQVLDGGTPRDQQEDWMRKRLAEGWTLGPVKDYEAKTHPCLVPYEELSATERRKDDLFAGVVRALADTR